MNPFDIHASCINIVKSETLFEQYRMALNREKHNIEVQNDNVIKRKLIFFDLMQRDHEISIEEAECKGN